MKSTEPDPLVINRAGNWGINRVLGTGGGKFASFDR
jgi:hypothetical protein